MWSRHTTIGGGVSNKEERHQQQDQQQQQRQRRRRVNSTSTRTTGSIKTDDDDASVKPVLVEEDFEALVSTKVFPNRPIAEKRSRYAGISWEAVTKKWRARARDTVLKRDVYLGVFTEELEAALAIKNYIEFGKLHPLQRPKRRKEDRVSEGDGGGRDVPGAGKRRKKRENEKKNKTNVRVAVARKPTTRRESRGSGRAPHRGPSPKGPSKQSQAVGRDHPKYGLVGRGHPKYRGVNVLPTTAKGERLWRARICVNGQLTHLGAFSTAKSAAVAYNNAAKRLGRTEQLNIISDDDDDEEEEEEEEEEDEDDEPNRRLVVDTAPVKQKSTPKYVPYTRSSFPRSSPAFTSVAPPIGPPQPVDNKDNHGDDGEDGGGEDEDEDEDETSWEGVWRRAFRRVLEKHYS